MENKQLLPHAGDFVPPSVDYLPRKPKFYHPRIGLIGAGGIAKSHLRNYRRIGLDVAVICDLRTHAAEALRDEFFPDADVCSDYREVLARPDIEVVDLTPHPVHRLPLIEAALLAGKHVLSQKPFVLDVADATRLAALAKAENRKLAVNQNGRWAPHFSYIRNAITRGLIGEVVSVDFTTLFDHTWIRGIPAFESLRHMVLYDFSIHWFDILNCFMAGKRAERVYASVRSFPGQVFAPPPLASVIVDYPGAQARMNFTAHAQFGVEDSVVVVGTKGALRSVAPQHNAHSQIEEFTAEGKTTVPLEGTWLINGFEGTMGELLCAIEEDREPVTSALNNVASLELCFAALASADSGTPVSVGTVTKVDQLTL